MRLWRTVHSEWPATFPTRSHCKLHCRETFCWLPLAYCLNKQVLVLHGGLFSEDNVTLDDIRRVDRFREPSDAGIMSECLWSDPQPEKGRAPSKRGCGIQFGVPCAVAF